MSLYRIIKDYSQHSVDGFTRAGLVNYLAESGHRYSATVVGNALSKMKAEGSLRSVRRGVYQFASEKALFNTELSNENKKIYDDLKQSFPFVDVCAWESSAFLHLVQHVPNMRYLLIEVEKDVVDSVANKLSQLTDRLVLRNPSVFETEQYALGRDVVVVKPLISQSPLWKSTDIVRPRIEKILVDLLCDDIFYPFRGIETRYIYENAFDSFEVNAKLLRRYAARRSKQEIVERFIPKGL